MGVAACGVVMGIHLDADPRLPPAARLDERGELIRVAPLAKRQLVNRGPGPLHLLAIGAAGEHRGRDGMAYTAWDATEFVTPQEMPMPEDLPASELRG